MLSTPDTVSRVCSIWSQFGPSFLYIPYFSLANVLFLCHECTIFLSQTYHFRCCKRTIFLSCLLLWTLWFLNSFAPIFQVSKHVLLQHQHGTKASQPMQVLDLLHGNLYCLVTIIGFSCVMSVTCERVENFNFYSFSLPGALSLSLPILNTSQRQLLDLLENQFMAAITAWFQL